MVIPARRFRSNNINTTNFKESAESCDKLDSRVNNIHEATPLQTKQPIGNLKSRNKFKEDHLNEECVIYLISGIKLQGYLRGFDEEIIILESLDKINEQVVIYQSTIATIQFEL
ncbi:MAG: RNA chaperone Hfq [Gammaproteobacteria bacterium]|jgi:sRNA-binding regulator protein Hfq